MGKWESEKIGVLAFMFDCNRREVAYPCTPWNVCNHDGFIIGGESPADLYMSRS